MSLNNLILLTVRTIEQGTALEGDKTSEEGVKAAALCFFDEKDFESLNCEVGTPVKVRTDYGEVITYSVISEEGPHPGIIWIPMGPWANQVVNPDSYSCGTPTFKGVKASLEVVKDGKVLDALELMKTLRE